jgi:Ser/Thr protein kinase RdoA (MazF antagonist)
MAADHRLREVLSAYGYSSLDTSICVLGKGNINDTYLITAGSASLVLQRINEKVFSSPTKIIENFWLVSSHLLECSLSLGESFRVAAPLAAKNGALYVRDSGGGYWRAQEYLAHQPNKKLVGTTQACSVGRVLGRFHRLLAKLNHQALHDPLPGFHNLPLYLADFDALSSRHRNRKTAQSGSTEGCLEMIEAFRDKAAFFQQAIVNGDARLQAVHGDPKLDNFIFSDEGYAVGMIDLDTVGSGLIEQDLGDCLRSCCNLLGELSAELKKPVFDLDCCRAILEGYFSVAQELTSCGQIVYIFEGISLITFELGLRFFTDHLRGNSYFKVERDGDNLARAVVQFALLEDIVAKETEIRQMVDRLAGSSV